MTRFLRIRPRLSAFLEPTVAEPPFRKGPNDKPAGIRHDHRLLRAVGIL